MTRVAAQNSDRGKTTPEPAVRCPPGRANSVIYLPCRVSARCRPAEGLTLRDQPKNLVWRAQPPIWSAIGAAWEAVRSALEWLICGPRSSGAPRCSWD